MYVFSPHSFRLAQKYKHAAKVDGWDCNIAASHIKDVSHIKATSHNEADINSDASINNKIEEWNTKSVSDLFYLGKGAKKNKRII